MLTNLGDLIVMNPSRARLCIEDMSDIDTGDSDGSGEIAVRATSAQTVTARSFLFKGVTVETSGDYSTWAEDSLKEEAQKMLARDYTEEVD